MEDILGAKYHYWRKGMWCDYRPQASQEITIVDCVTISDRFLFWGRGYGEMAIMIDKVKGSIPLMDIEVRAEQLKLRI